MSTLAFMHLSFANPSVFLSSILRFGVCQLRHGVYCCGRERFWKALAVRNAVEMDKYNAIQSVYRSIHLSANFNPTMPTQLQLDKFIHTFRAYIPTIISSVNGMYFPAGALRCRYWISSLFLSRLVFLDVPGRSSALRSAHWGLWGREVLP